MKHRSLVGLLVILLLVTAATPVLASSPGTNVQLHVGNLTGQTCPAGTRHFIINGLGEDLAHPSTIYVQFLLPNGTYEVVTAEVRPDGGPVAHYDVPGPEGEVHDAWVFVSQEWLDEWSGQFNLSNDTCPPLSVSVRNLQAVCHSQNTQVTWVTMSEVDIMGFNLYRAESDQFADATLITDAPIPAQSPGSTQGWVYGYLDWSVTPQTTYWYWLEVIDLAGGSDYIGPAAAVCAPTAVTLAGFGAASDNGKFSPDLPVLLVVAVVLVGGWYLVTHSTRRRRPTS